MLYISRTRRRISKVEIVCKWQTVRLLQNTGLIGTYLYVSHASSAAELSPFESSSEMSTYLG